MSFAVEPPKHADKPIQGGDTDPEKATLVLQELDRIVNSRFFKNALRSRQFLEYVVRHKLEGHYDQLKERTIGAGVFQRSPGYATGDDPVVRVQAGEVRRRLEQYYQSAHDRSPVRIELPVGSYSPNIQLNQSEAVPVTVASDTPGQPAPPATPAPESFASVVLRGRWSLGILVVALALILGMSFAVFHRQATPKSGLEQFWAPVFATQQPVLICLAKPVVYRPSLELYQRYARKHPGTFQTEVERSNQVLPLAAEDKLQWSEILHYPDYGVAVGDAHDAVRVSGLLGQMGKASQVRIGTNYSFEDLRNSPAVIVGAFNNKWTMQIAPTLHFAFVEDRGDYSIREQIPGGRVWRSNLHASEQYGEDFAIVARLLDSKTGQFTLIAAGLTSSGTQSAGEFISNPDFLEKALQNLPSGWQKKSLEVVVQTTVTDSVAGPPQVIATWSW